jgi:hypothetical protein
VTLRLVAAALLAIVVAIPFGILPAAPVTWLAVVALGVGGAGVITRSTTVVTVAGAVALIGHAVALLLARPTGALLDGLALGAALVLLLAVVHFAERAADADLGAGVMAAQVRQWLGTVLLGVVVALALLAGAAAIAGAIIGATLPVVVIAATIGAALVVAGVVVLVR